MSQKSSRPHSDLDTFMLGPKPEPQLPVYEDQQIFWSDQASVKMAENPNPETSADQQDINDSPVLANLQKVHGAMKPETIAASRTTK